MSQLPTPLRTLAMGYLHEDFDLEHGSPLDAIAAFRNDSPAAFIDEMKRDISSLLSTRDEAGLKAAWQSEGGSAYDPSRHGMTYRQWFEKVLEILHESA